jgi:tetratricopeptide (TPR) repeat protein
LEVENPSGSGRFDRTNAVFAALVFIISFVVYALTVQRSLSFWDCGEFIACAYTLGIPHPPGTPLFVLLGRLFSLIPFVEDISWRVNYLSVISSSFTTVFSYLIIVRIVGTFFRERKDEPTNRWIAFVSGVAGALFVAFSQTNWANSVETEVYGPSLALMTLMTWLTLRYLEQRGTPEASRTMVLTFYLALAGVGIHMTPFLIVPVLAIFYLLKKEATAREWALVCGFFIVELLLIVLLSDTTFGYRLFFLITAALGVILVLLIYRFVNWGVAIAIISLCSLMLEFSYFMFVAPLGILALIILGSMGPRFGLKIRWRAALVVLVMGVVGFSSHIYIPIRSADTPRINENNPARDFLTFRRYLDRKQYGQESMVKRMFSRRGLWENQLGRHEHMGFWSYFEEQYSGGGWTFVPFLLLGLIGMAVAIRKRLEIGLPFFTLFIVCSLGLVLYMNFADGTQYDGAQAYLEVRNRDYFFTPAFVFFGIAIGLGIGAVIAFLRERLAEKNAGLGRLIAYASTVVMFLPTISLAHSYHANDRSENFLPYNYATNLLSSCDENAILFTSGDNDTFPVWCVQEVYNYRRDVRVVNLSLLNTDWYVWQMKDIYDVPISLSREQIWWYPYEESRFGRTGEVWRPRERFTDRPRGRQAYMQAGLHAGKFVRVQDMMMDEIVLQNRWKDPIHFTSQPYAESPLKLSELTAVQGLTYKLLRRPEVPQNRIIMDRSLELYRDAYRYEGLGDSRVFRDDNATGVVLGLGTNAVRIFDALRNEGKIEEAREFIRSVIEQYPEYWQATYVLAESYEAEDSAIVISLMQSLHDTLASFAESNPYNLFYLQDLGMVMTELGRRTDNRPMVDEGIALMWEAYARDPNSAYFFQKLVSVLQRDGQVEKIREAAEMIAQYPKNLENPYVLQVVQALGAMPSGFRAPGT